MFGAPNSWSARAVLLAEVLHIYETSLCSSCGQSAALSFDPLNTGHFRVDDSTVCLGCEALENHREHTKDPWPGTRVFVMTDLGGDNG